MSEHKDRVKPFEQAVNAQKVDAQKGSPSRPRPDPQILASEGEDRFDDFVRRNTFEEAMETAEAPAVVLRSGHAPLKWLIVAVCVLVVTLLSLNAYFTLMDYYGRGWIPGLIATIPMLAVAGTLLWFCGRELRGYWSLRAVDHLRQQASHLQKAREPGDALAFAHRVAHLYRGDADIQARFQAFLEGYSDTHAQAEVLAIFSRDVLRPLDERAYQVITRCGIQSATLTAVSSLASLDMLLSLWRNLRMLRELASIYGLRPGFARNFSLARHALEALAVSGASEIVSDMMAENLGNHVIGALSARLGDGLSNGLMTARLGLIIAAECRPMPFTAQDRHGFRQLRANILRAFREATRRKP